MNILNKESLCKKYILSVLIKLVFIILCHFKYRILSEKKRKNHDYLKFLVDEYLNKISFCF